MKYAWPLLLQLLALIAGIAEAILPSFGILSILCAALFAYSWYWILSHLGSAAPWAFGGADLILIPLSVWIAFKLMNVINISHSATLGSGSGLDAEEQHLQKLIGLEGLVESPLRPIGKVLVNGDVYEAKTESEFLSQGEKIQVQKIYGNQIIVARI